MDTNSNSKDEKKQKKTLIKNGLESQFKVMTRVPVIIMGIVIMISSYCLFLSNVEKEVQRNLKNVAESVVVHYSQMYEGEYEPRPVEDGSYHLFKGDTDLSILGGSLDEFKAVTGTDLTLFYLDVRMATTLKDENGEKINYTFASKIVSDAVILQKKECFYNNVEISGMEYYAYYMPLLDSKGDAVGMMFAGKPTSQVVKEAMLSTIWMPIITLIMTIVAGWISSERAKAIVDCIKEEKKFLKEISTGNLNANLDVKVIARKDEIGDMGRFSRSVQKFLREMIERDTLTNLYTRRIGETKIKLVQEQLKEAGVKYCVCMGDIDFFKKFNDTYGHDCGDIVLKEVARIFNEYMIGHGFNVRWGGEEFLMIFENSDLDKAHEHLKKIRQAILDNEVSYKDEKLKITMTYGLVSGDERPIEDIVKEADNMLYFGKQNGRNRIVIPSDMETIEVVEEKK